LALLAAVCTLSHASAQSPQPASLPPLPAADVQNLAPPSSLRPVQGLDVEANGPKLPGPPKRDPLFAQGMSKTDPKYGTANTNEDLLDYNIRLDPPGAELLFGRLDSEWSLQERMRQENKNRPQAEKVMFPELPVLASTAFSNRTFPAAAIFAEPNYVNYKRLHFEEKNSERFGWELGILQPVVSTATFYKDVFFLPSKVASHYRRGYETSAGYCLPGEPVPYLLYPPEVTVAGAVAQAGVLVGLYAIIP
jgi:hypothetical protein